MQYTPWETIKELLFTNNLITVFIQEDETKLRNYEEKKEHLNASLWLHRVQFHLKISLESLLESIIACLAVLKRKFLTIEKEKQRVP